MSLKAYIDETGFHAPSYPEILEAQQQNFRAVFGQDVYLEADSQEGQMLAQFSLALYDAYQLAGSVYNAFSPQTAQGAGLSRMVKLNGLRRKVATNSTVDVRIVGVAGTIISSGVVQDVARQRWNLPTSVVIPETGEITVTATAQELGDLQAASGEVSSIVTPTRGWQSVSNAAAATPGAPVETDYALRRRQAVSTSLPSQTVLEGIVGAVANLDGVIRFKGYENDDDSTDANGLPPGAISIVVEGGDDAAIAQAIAVKKTPGGPTYGTTSVVVRDSFGMPNTIRFFRPTPVAVDLVITLAPLPGYVSTTGQAILENLANALNDLAIGEDVLWSRLFTPINAAEPDASRKTFDLVTLAIGRHEGTLATANLELAFDEVATGDVANMTISIES